MGLELSGTFKTMGKKALWSEGVGVKPQNKALRKPQGPSFLKDRLF